MKRKRASPLCVLLSSLLSGCGITVSNPPPSALTQGITPAEQILETSQSAVEGCRLLGIVENASILGGGYGLAGLPAAKETAIGRARVLGATHIVWLDVMQGGRVASSDAGFNDDVLVNGAAYYCEDKEASLIVQEEKKVDGFTYSAAQLQKKTRMKLIDSNRSEVEEVREMPERISSEISLDGVTTPEFSSDTQPNAGYGKSINVDTGENPFLK